MTTSVAQALNTAGVSTTKRVRKIAPVITTPKETQMKSARVVPPGTMAALAVASSSGSTFFDPIDLLEDKLGHQAALHSRVMESMAWMLGASCIGQARSVLFTRYQEQETEHTNTVSFNDFCQGVAETIDHPSIYGRNSDNTTDLEASEGAHESPEAVLAILLAVYEQWHDAAARAAAADNRDYKSKSWREQMESEKVKAPDIGTRVNYRKIADLEARGDTAKAERLYASYMEANALAAASRVDNNKSLMPTILEILRTAGRYALESSRFDELPLLKQRQLTTFAIGAIDRSRNDLASRMSKQPIAFGHIAEAAFQATEALNKVVMQKFNDVGELENVRSQVSINMERGAKRVACSID
jgi:hypothetical protein